MRHRARLLLLEYVPVALAWRVVVLLAVELRAFDLHSSGGDCPVARFKQ